METIYVALSDSYTDGSEIQVSVDHDQDHFVVMDLDTLTENHHTTDGGLVLSATEADRLGIALCRAASAARVANTEAGTVR